MRRRPAVKNGGEVLRGRREAKTLEIKIGDALKFL
jgi:hypothetical protein